ncbi:VanZ family protein [Parahaliea sp. F7430]|uniref:VanZ family protein n=1 Tax=Sediminihaliea albiluteola TaxID=2758564 RepID=A0A7W2TUT3_9GAMM|nr:VanZ family protein [Sediminihaliea albiluteola]MBA6412304.1 VanZ family protein [Sediminihaliea albiluteola]
MRLKPLPLGFYKVLAILSPLAILILLATPGDIISAAIRWLSDLLSLKQVVSSSQFSNSDKVVHALLFFFCSYFVIRAQFFDRLHWRWIFALLVFYAGFTELLQFPIATRGASWGDFVADTLGIVLGMLWTLAIRPNQVVFKASSA